MTRTLGLKLGRGDRPEAAPERWPVTRERRSERLGGALQEELVQRAQAGDLGAFDELYALNVGRVHALCLRMSGDRQRAEQLTQDAFVHAWTKLATFRGDSAFSSWLHRLAVNVILEQARREKRRDAHVMIVEDAEVFESATATGDPWARIDLERAITLLPPGARNVFVLFDIEGYPQEEIAELLGIAVGTVKAQLHRARRLLRESLGR